jgi:excisionase family DNA binding protein
MYTLDRTNMELLTIDETAKLLKVTPTTVRRYISAGQLPALKFGRRVRIRKEAVEGLLSPVTPKPPHAKKQEEGGRMAETERAVIARLTDEQVEQALAAVEQARRSQEEQLARRNGELFSPSWELLNEARDQRTRDLT